MDAVEEWFREENVKHVGSQDMGLELGNGDFQIERLERGETTH